MGDDVATTIHTDVGSPEPIPYDEWVQMGRVDGRIYTDPRIFEQEIERIFERDWVYVAHESELPVPGAFVTDVVGRQPIVVTRAADGQLHAVANRCSHRGTMLCRAERGVADTFTCIYHAWKFRNTGELLGATFPDAYGPDFDKSCFDLARVPRLATYRGFVFVSLSPDGPLLDEHLGDTVREQIDQFVELSPLGTVTMAGGVLRYWYRGNWKATVENAVDAYHAQFVHRYWMAKVRHVREDGGSPGVSHGAVAPRTRSLGRGHTMIDFRAMREAIAERTGRSLPTEFDQEILALQLDGERRPDVMPTLDPVDAAAYGQAMTEAYGAEKARRLMVHNGTHIAVFPNFALIGASVRKIRPLAVDRTEILVQAAMLDGAPPAMNTLRIRGVEDFWGPASQGHADDAEVWELANLGLRNTLRPWVDLSRGLHREEVDADGTLVGQATDEGTQRELVSHWLALMTGRPA
jgi:phenylpropionate dioxygenase-like ring-hydroxylating dioxygenase large terminal subunit